MPRYRIPGLILLLLALACGGRRPEVPILTYHSISAASDGFTVSEAAFAAELDALKAKGFHAILFREWLEHQDRRAPLPSNPLLLTFDDGYQDAVTTVLPALRARGMRATFFLVSGWIGADEAHRFARVEDGVPRRYLIWPEVRALAAAGMEIGSHGATHRRLPELPEAQAREELLGSKRSLDQGLGASVEVFAYPYNAARRSLRPLVREAGYAAAVAGSVHGGADRFELRRTSIYRSTTPEELLRALSR